ncbi:DUF4366 domain-containing protein [Candidatus Saccharibacteria bacterium]|jgi:flagellar basal body-associated protein FliL|uniref:DUF4366 domain-containing protein n=1 Tax=Dehalobacterium formicoaceticum TaxID=51515 RepID=A0ABT1Y849_9FIRM|nr:DUF4366 domain-containing protein [Dehalobacterium formicoaceticum]MCR6547063.1 DUF4366 domain-containing protein [Dehalobacterium formicoaceticum]NLA43688.1 DUF4366 domain-containing protein [Candidatus Saccharibacteria bacterium]
MKNKKIRILTALFAVVLCMAAFPLTAYAGGGETEPPAETKAPEPEQPANPNPVSLTPDGNLTLVDDIEGEQSEDKQFITVVTKNGNYFYIIIDRAGDTDNVYFLNMVDETDLLALIEDMDTVPQTPTVTPPADPEPDPQPTTEPEPEPEKKGGAGGILIFLVVLVAAGGAFYYFKIFKPKQAVQGGTDLSELDELDFDDGDDEYLSAEANEQEDDTE